MLLAVFTFRILITPSHLILPVKAVSLIQEKWSPSEDTLDLRQCNRRAKLQFSSLSSLTAVIENNLISVARISMVFFYSFFFFFSTVSVLF